jgi:hypothetical protein
MALAASPERAPDLLTVPEAASLAGVHPDTVRGWCARGLVPSCETAATAGGVSAGVTWSAGSENGTGRPRGRQRRCGS